MIKEMTGIELVTQTMYKSTSEALKTGRKSISSDPDLVPPGDPAADIDEGELARLEGQD